MEVRRYASKQAANVKANGQEVLSNSSIATNEMSSVAGCQPIVSDCGIFTRRIRNADQTIKAPSEANNQGSPDFGRQK
jgi:hypothetical protein